MTAPREKAGVVDKAIQWARQTLEVGLPDATPDALAVKRHVCRAVEAAFAALRAAAPLLPSQDESRLREALTLLLAKVRRDAPDLSGKLLGFCDAALASPPPQAPAESKEPRA